MARSGGLLAPFGPSSQAPTLFRFALLEPEEVLIISVVLTDDSASNYKIGKFCAYWEVLKWRAREDDFRPSGRRRRLRRCFASLYSNLTEVLIHPKRNSDIGENTLKGN